MGFADTMAARLAGYGPRPCIESEHTWYTGDDIQRYVTLVEDALNRAGVSPAEPVGLVVRNRVAHAAVILGFVADRPARLDDLLVSVRTRRRPGHPDVAAPGRHRRPHRLERPGDQRRTGDRQRGAGTQPHRTPGGTAGQPAPRISPRRFSNRGFTFSPAVRPAHRSG